jgi:putative ATPase
VALQVAVAAKEAVDFVGMPEAVLNLSQAVTYLATAPKSNASYMACVEAKEAVSEYGALPVPMHLRNAPTRLMRELGYRKGYRYPHDTPEGFVAENYMPKGLEGSIYYKPTNRGFEKIILERLTAWRAKRSGKGGGKKGKD